MRYNISINNKKAVEWGFNIQQAYLFVFFYELASWADSITHNGESYYYASKNKAIEEMPLLTKKRDTMYRYYKQIESKGLIKVVKFEGKDYIRLTEKGKQWNCESEHSEKNPNKVGKKSESNSENNPTYNSTKYNNSTSNNKSRAKRFSPPSLGEVKAYCFERNNEIDPEYFIDFYTSKNWMIGKNKMKDWKAAVRTWEKKEKSFAKKEKEPNQINDYDQKEQNLLAQLKKSLIQVYGDFTDTEEHKRIINEIRTELLKIDPGTVKDHYKRIVKYCDQKRGTEKQYLKNLKSLIHGS